MGSIPRGREDHHRRMHFDVLLFLGAGGSSAATIACRCVRIGNHDALSSSGPGRAHLIEHVFELILRQGATFDVFDCAQLSCHALAVFFLDRLHLLPRQLVAHLRVIAQIGLGADNEARDARAMVVHFGEPFLTNILKGGRRGNGKADQKDVGLWV